MEGIEARVVKSLDGEDIELYDFRKQLEECEVLENELKCATWLLRKTE